MCQPKDSTAVNTSNPTCVNQCASSFVACLCLLSLRVQTIFQVFRRHYVSSSIDNHSTFSRRNYNKNSHLLIIFTKTIGHGPSRVRSSLHGEILTVSKNTEKKKQKTRTMKNNFKKIILIPNSSSHQDGDDCCKECKNIISNERKMQLYYLCLVTYGAPFIT